MKKLNNQQNYVYAGYKQSEQDIKQNIDSEMKFDIYEQLNLKSIQKIKTIISDHYDILNNMRFISKDNETQDKDQISQQNLKQNQNYGDTQKYDETFEISFELKEQTEKLKAIKTKIEASLGNRTQGINYFLDDSNEENIKASKEYDIKIIDMLKNDQGPFNGSCLRDTWSKGRDFFFINNGEYLKVINITQNGKYALCEYDQKFGYLHVNDLRIYGHII